MAYFHWFNLCIIFGLISYSCQFNVPNHKVRRDFSAMGDEGESRQAKEEEKDDHEQHDQLVHRSLQQDKEQIAQICAAISQAVERMAAPDSTDVSCAPHWTQVQSSLRDGLQIIIAAYRRYIQFLREIMESIERFANDMISSYEMELAAIDKMSAPSESEETNSEAWKTFSRHRSALLDYGKLHLQTLQTAADCTADLTGNSMQLRRLNTRIPLRTQTQVIRIVQSPIPQYSLQSGTCSCADYTADNGCEACSYNIAARSLTLANHACNQCISYGASNRFLYRRTE